MALINVNNDYLNLLIFKINYFDTIHINQKINEVTSINQ